MDQGQIIEELKEQLKEVQTELDNETNCVHVLLKLIAGYQYKDSLVKKLAKNSDKVFKLSEKQLNDILNYFKECEEVEQRG